MEKISFLHYFFVFIEFSGVVVLSFAMFRIPLSLHKINISIIALTMAAVSFIVRDVMDGFNYSVLFVIAVYILLLVILQRLPMLYASLICLTGYLAAAVIQLALGILGMNLGMTSTEQLSELFIHYTLLGVLTAIICFLISYIIHLKKLGFMFVVKHFQGKSALKGYNFFLAALLLTVVVIIQLAVLSFKINSVHLYVLFGMLCMFIIAIYSAYQHNRTHLREKYKRAA